MYYLLQGLSFHLGAVLLSLGFITYVEHGMDNSVLTQKSDSLLKVEQVTRDVICCDPAHTQTLKNCLIDFY